jgi:hypothetical protein
MARTFTHGFSLHAAVRWRADQRLELEQLCPLYHPASHRQRTAQT